MSDKAIAAIKSAPEPISVADAIKVYSLFAVSPFRLSLAIVKLGLISRVTDGNSGGALLNLMCYGVVGAGIATMPVTLPLCLVTSTMAVASGVALAVVTPIQSLRKTFSSNINAPQPTETTESKSENENSSDSPQPLPGKP